MDNRLSVDVYVNSWSIARSKCEGYRTQRSEASEYSALSFFALSTYTYQHHLHSVQRYHTENWFVCSLSLLSSMKRFLIANFYLIMFGNRQTVAGTKNGRKQGDDVDEDNDMLFFLSNFISNF